MFFEQYLLAEQKRTIANIEDIRKKANKLRNELNNIIIKRNGDIYEIFNFLKNRSFILGSEVSQKIKDLEEYDCKYKKESIRLQKINNILDMLDKKKTNEEKIEIFEKFCLNYDLNSNKKKDIDLT